MGNTFRRRITKQHELNHITLLKHNITRFHIKRIHSNDIKHNGFKIVQTNTQKTKSTPNIQA